MNPQTIRLYEWYLLAIEDFLTSPKLAEEKHHLTYQSFLNILREHFQVENLTEAREKIRSILQGEIEAKNLPDNESLEYWQKELQKKRGDVLKIDEQVVKDVRTLIERQIMAYQIGQTLNKYVLTDETTKTKGKGLNRQVRSVILQALKEEKDEVSRETYPQLLQHIKPSINAVLLQSGITLTEKQSQEVLREFADKTLISSQFLQKWIRTENKEGSSTVFINKFLGISPVLPLISDEGEIISVSTPPIEEIITSRQKQTTIPPAAAPTPASPQTETIVREEAAVAAENIAFTPLMAILSPQLAASFLKKVALAPIVKTLQFLDLVAGDELDENNQDAWREKLHQGLTSGDLIASLETLKATGVAPHDPTRQKLESHFVEMQAYEQAHPRLASILKNYHEFSKITGRRQITLSEEKILLPRLVPAPFWQEPTAAATPTVKLKNWVNSLGLRLHFYEPATNLQGQKILRFTLPDKFITAFSLGKFRDYRTFKSWVAIKAIKPLSVRFGKTLVGGGFKKLAAGLIGKLGLAAIPTGVTQVVAAAWLLKDALTFGVKIVKGLINQLRGKSSVAIALGLTAIAGAFLLPILPILSTVLLVVGALTLAIGVFGGIKAAVGGIISGVGSGIGSLASGLGGFFSSLSTLSLPAGLTLMPVAAVGGVGAVTTLMIISTSSAFIKTPTKNVGTITPYAACALTADTPGANSLKELFVNASQWAGIPPAILAAIASIEGDYMFGFSDGQVQSYSVPGAQVPNNCSPNGCGARGPMQFLNDGVASDCGAYTGKTMPDVWGVYKGAVNQALPNDPRTPEICNLKDSLYAGAWKIKTDSGTDKNQTCSWDKATVDKVATGYFGETACTQIFASLGNKTYCQYVWDYYQKRNLVQSTYQASGWFFWQSDPRWSSYSGGFSCGTLGTHGCGPTSLAMVFVHNGLAMDPPHMWDVFLARKSMSCEGATNYGSVFVNYARESGLEVIDLSPDWNWPKIEEALKKGYVVVANTTQFGGHFLVIRGMDGNKVITNDPAFNNGDGATYDRNQMGWKGLFWAYKK